MNLELIRLREDMRTPTTSSAISPVTRSRSDRRQTPPERQSTSYGHRREGIRVMSDAPGRTSGANLKEIRRLLREHPGARIQTQRGIGATCATYYKIVGADPLSRLKHRAELALLRADVEMAALRVEDAERRSTRAAIWRHSRTAR
jgi:hypothetical protein